MNEILKEATPVLRSVRDLLMHLHEESKGADGGVATASGEAAFLAVRDLDEILDAIKQEGEQHGS